MPMPMLVLVLIHVFLDHARYHHARLAGAWLARPDCRIKRHFLPACCPHLNPVERLWGLMHKHVTHNKCDSSCTRFTDATPGFLREKVPRCKARDKKGPFLGLKKGQSVQTKSLV